MTSQLTIRRARHRCLFAMAAAWLIFGSAPRAQTLTGTLIGTVRDVQGGVVAGAEVRVSSAALLDGPVSLPTNAKGQLRFPNLPPGSYVVEIEVPGFARYRDEHVQIGAGATIELLPVLKPASVQELVVIDGGSSRIEARDSGFSSRFTLQDLRTIPSRRASMFDLLRVAPGVSPTSPSSGNVTTISAFGSGTNENQFLFDGTNFTCPCNGVARTEPGIDFIQEVQVQSVGASAEFGNVQGAVINVITRQGGDRFAHDASYYGQSARLTSRPVRLAIPHSAPRESGYERVRFRDFTTNLGGPAIRGRLWFFGGYQYLRDHDSQPGTDPAFPRTYEQDKVFAKLTWKPSTGTQLVQSFHEEFWLSPARPTRVTPFEATTRTHASVPAVSIGPFTHVLSANTVWDVRAGGFSYNQESPPSTGDRTTPSRRDRFTEITSGAPPQFGDLTIRRLTAKATLTHYRAALFGADHEWRAGVQLERGEHHSFNVIPTGVRYVDDGGLPFRAISAAPSTSGGRFDTGALFASDAITVGDRLTINAGIRFDHSRAISQDLHALDGEGRETTELVQGLGHLYTWNILSPRFGVTWKLATDGRTVLRASHGRFSQGMLTGELGFFHPGISPLTTAAFDTATGGYTRVVERTDPGQLTFDRQTSAPRTDEYSVGLDRRIHRSLAVAVAYVHKRGANFIGWRGADNGYREELRALGDGRSVPVFVLENAPVSRRFILTNPDEYSMRYDGLVVVVDKRHGRGWQATGSYTFSRAVGLQPSSGSNAAAAQVSTVGPPYNLTFGRDRNDLTNAYGRLPNDRPHMLRVMGSVHVPKTGIAFAANLQHFSGKPWTATAQVLLPGSQGDRRIMIEPRGSRRLSSQMLLDVRVSRPLRLGGARLELLLDVLNALDESAEEGLATDTLLSLDSGRFNPEFGKPTVFVDPRRAMFGVRWIVGR